MPTRKLRRSESLRIVGQQTNHVVEKRLGELDAGAIPRGWSPLLGLPEGGRDECKDGPRPCRYVQCKHHLWLVEGSDRQGRRHANGGAPKSVLRAATFTSCALDVAEREHTAEYIGKLMNMSKRRVQQIVKGAIQKLQSRVDDDARDELMELLQGDRSPTMAEGCGRRGGFVMRGSR